MALQLTLDLDIFNPTPTGISILADLLQFLHHLMHPFVAILNTLSSFILVTLPNHWSLLNLIFLVSYVSLYNLQISWLYLFCLCPLTNTGPYIFLRTFLSDALSTFSAVCDNVHASLPYHKTDLISVLHNSIFFCLCGPRLTSLLAEGSSMRYWLVLFSSYHIFHFISLFGDACSSVDKFIYGFNRVSSFPFQYVYRTWIFTIFFCFIYMKDKPTSCRSFQLFVSLFHCLLCSTHCAYIICISGYLYEFVL